MEGSIYGQSSSTYNNIANLGSRMWETWGNQRLGVASQGMANAQANSAQAAENNAALQRAGIETAGTLAGAYFGSQKGTGTQLTNTGYTSQLYDEGTGTFSTYNSATAIG
jgi:hypothetical protein